VPLSGAAKARLDELVKETLALQRKHHQRRTHGVVGRLKEHVARLALIAAVSANPKDPRVELEHVAWGERIARASIGIMLDAAEKHIADSDHQRHRNGVLADIARLAGPKNIPVQKRDLTKGGSTARKLDEEHRTKCLRDLIEMELVEECQRKVGGQDVKFYRLIM
jgi:hypothetical protein